jgi:hypothetical protein
MDQPQQTDVIKPKPPRVQLVPEYVPAEAFLETIGYFTPSSKRIRRQWVKEKTLSERTMADGTTKTLKTKVSANHELGLPITSDQDYYRAFLKICDELVSKDGRFQLPLAVPTDRLMRYAGKTDSAPHRREVRDWFRRMTGTMIEGGLYRAKQKTYDDGFLGTVFSQVLLTGQTTREGRPADTNYVWLSPWWLSNYYYGHRRLFDNALYRRLRKPIAKALLNLLETGWYAAGGKPYTKSYTDLCAEFLLSEYRQVSRIKEQLEPAHRELAREGILSLPVRYQQTAAGDGFKLTWNPGPKWRGDQETREQRRQLADHIENGTRPAPAAPRVGETPADQAEAQAAVIEMHVRDIIEYTGDQKSEANWRQLVGRAVRERRAHVVHQALSETRATDQPPGTVANKGALVNARLRELLKQFDLFSPPANKVASPVTASTGAPSAPDQSGETTPRARPPGLAPSEEPTA